MPEQNYANHTRNVPVFFGALIVLLLTVMGATVNLYLSIGDHQRLYSAALVWVISICLLIVALSARTFSLKAQDRAIRAEENLRHFVMTGKLLDPRLSCLQIVALRFASDGEMVALAARAANESMAPKDIKQAVKNWRADEYRV